MSEIPYKNKWLSSYETLCFNTPDGDIAIGEYAESGTGYYIRTKPKDEAQFEKVQLPYDVSNLKEVKVLAGQHCYYDEFLTAEGADAIWSTTPTPIPEGGVKRVQSTGKLYWDTARIKYYPQPERIELVDVLPPPEPPQPRNAPQSIALDATTNSGEKGVVSSYSWSHECTGANRLLVVGDSHRAIFVTRTVTGITFNGDALTDIRDDTTGASETYTTSIFYMVAPDAGGSYTIEVTLSGDISHGGGGAISYTGAAQTGQPDADNGATGSDDTPTVDVTTVADNSWVVSILQGTDSATSDNTERWNIDTGIILDYPAAGSDTNGPKTPAGAQTMSWDASDSNPWAISAASFAPVAAGPSEIGQFIFISKLMIPFIWLRQGEASRRRFIKNTIASILGV